MIGAREVHMIREQREELGRGVIYLCRVVRNIVNISPGNENCAVPQEAGQVTLAIDRYPCCRNEVVRHWIVKVSALPSVQQHLSVSQ